MNSLERYIRELRERYGRVLVANYRDFFLVGREMEEPGAPLERYTLAASAAAFWRAAERARETDAEHGERFTEYLRRVLLHTAPSGRPEDVARFRFVTPRRFAV